MNSNPQVLIVEDDRHTLSNYLRILRSDEYELTGVRSLDEALAVLEQKTFDVVVTDLELFGHSDGGMQVIKQAKALDATIGVIMVTIHSNAENAYQAIRELGAGAFLPKPLDAAVCRQRIHNAILERRRRLGEIDQAKQSGFMRIRNPYRTGKALGQGDVMFYGRDEVFDFIRDNIGQPSRHSHLALIGPHRIGKTSILQQLPIQLGSDLLPVYINCQSLGVEPGMSAFFLQFSHHLWNGLKAQGVDVSSLPTLTKDDLDSTPTLAFNDIFLPQLRHILGNRSLVLCLDNFEELENKVQRNRLDIITFAFLRDLMLNENQIVCILAGSHRLELPETLIPETASILELVDCYQRIGVFSPDLARRLIEEPVADSGMIYQSEALQKILQATGGYPYLVHLLCSRLVNHCNQQDRNEMMLEDIQEAIDVLLDTTQPGFFWNSLTPYHQAVLICAAKLWQHSDTVTAEDIEVELQAAGLSYHAWPIPLQRLLRDLELEELIIAQSGDGKGLQYKQVFELLGAWVRRHKTLDQIRMNLESVNRKTNKDEIRTLIAKKQQRLQKLKEQQALLGVSTPPEISIEIESIEADIEKLKGQIDKSRD